ncbi:MAG TPA: MFS transporter [Caulobacteraceae bacterium]|nr:MFS transporter [Caulobacteraceae bacterium]
MAAAAGMTAQGRRAAGLSTRHVAAAVVGNWLEFYDFIVFALFAVQIGHTFFPSHSSFAQMMLTWGTFFAGFLCRPIGAVFIGRFADRVGRKPAMLLSFGMMGFALAALVLIPGFSRIGYWAPVIAVACRIVQGFALGGEVGPTTAFLIEAAPAGQRGLYGAWQSASQSLANISGGLAGLLVNHVLTGPQFADYGWRIALGLGVLVLPFGLIIRRTLPETMENEELDVAAHPELVEGASLTHQLAGHWRVILLGLGLICGGTISTYIFTYMTTYAQKTLHFDAATAFLMTTCVGVAGFASSLLGGALSDRFGRRALMIWPRLVFLLAILPVFLVVSKTRDGAVLIALLATLNIVGNLTGVPALVALTESLRKEVRGLGTATVYATAVAVFGGTTPLVVTWLGEVSRNAMAPAWYLMAGTAVALIASILMVETVLRPRRP